MTTPPLPAGWYPDPEQHNGLRYWDGVTWTEHRAPAQSAPAHTSPAHAAPERPEQPPTPAEPAGPPGSDHVGAHRAPEPAEPESGPNTLPEPLPITDQPTTRVPVREPAPYADATTPTPAAPPAIEPPAGTEPPSPVDNRKLIMGFIGAVAALLLVLILAAVYAFVIH